MTHLLKSGTLRTALLAVATLGIGLVSSARADLILFNPTGGATIGGFNPGTSQISSLNFGSGDSVSLGAVPIVPGSTFQLYYQTQLVALNGPSGPLPTPAGLGTAYQITEVASFTERVVTANNATAVITVAPVQAPGSGVKVYFQDLTAPGAVPADANTGVGFNVGTVILSKNPISSQANFTDTTKFIGLPTVPLNGLPGGGFAGVTTDQGTGSSTLNLGVVTGYDPAFFVTPGLVTSAFSTNLRNNFNDILASQAFNDPALPPGSPPSIIPVVGANNGTSGPDFLFQVSGATESFVVPEPASFAMAATALGIVPMTIWLRRRRQAKPRLA
jgi:hypothetical protein